MEGGLIKLQMYNNILDCIIKIHSSFTLIAYTDIGLLIFLDIAVLPCLVHHLV